MVTVLPFEDEADAIALANDTPYGLSGSIWTDNLSRALRVSRAVESGNLSVNSHSSVRYNTPFGGFKQSGLGRELGPDAPLSFTETKNVFFARRRMPDGSDPTTGRQGRGHHRRRQAVSALAAGRRMHAEGATIVIGDIDRAAGQAAADELGGMFVPVDVSDEAAVNKLFDTAADTYGRSTSHSTMPASSPPEDDLIENTELPAWQQVQDINLKSVYLSCRAALRHMVPAQKGSIINTASFVAVMGSATSQISYTASKGGVLAMSRELGVQFARQRDPRQRAVSRAGQHPAAAGAVRQGPRAGCAPAGTRAAGPVRRARRNSRRPWHSWPAMTRRSSPAPPSWSTAGSAPPT